jgi:N-acyl-L-homoserine lactone synthetase
VAVLITQVGTSEQLQGSLEKDLAVYRYKVFVERLGWDLPVAEAGLERDQFDRPDTLYALARDARGRICGCARLLPTTHPYLLGSVFPFLMDGQEPPCDAEVWELSRYTTEVVDNDAAAAEAAQERFRRLLQAVAQAVLEKGAKRLITFSYAGVERIARRFGLHVHRAGAMRLIDDKPVLAFWIELDAQTLHALDLAVPGAALH